MRADPAQPLRAVATLGPFARAALREGARGAVLAVFRRSFYVRMEEGALVCLGPPGLGAGPLNALCEGPAGLPWPTPAPGDAVRVRHGVLHVGAGARFALSGARLWLPPVLPPVAPARREAGLRRLRRACARSILPRGLAALVPALGGPPPAPATALEAALHAQVAMALAALEDWLAGPEASSAAPAAPGEPVPAALLGLLGLGGGLTPAGDDLLGGALIALRALGREDAAERLATVLLACAPVRTGAISAAHLAAAARGLGAAPLHAVLAALAEPGLPDAGALIEALRRLDGIGHTSGWDALAGVLAVWGAAPGVAMDAGLQREPDPVRIHDQAGEGRPC